MWRKRKEQPETFIGPKEYMKKPLQTIDDPLIIEIKKLIQEGRHPTLRYFLKGKLHRNKPAATFKIQEVARYSFKSKTHRIGICPRPTIDKPLPISVLNVDDTHYTSAEVHSFFLNDIPDADTRKEEEVLEKIFFGDLPVGYQIKMVKQKKGIIYQVIGNKYGILSLQQITGTIQVPFNSETTITQYTWKKGDNLKLKEKIPKRQEDIKITIKGIDYFIIGKNLQREKPKEKKRADITTTNQQQEHREESPPTLTKDWIFALEELGLDPNRLPNATELRKAFLEYAKTHHHDKIGEGERGFTFFDYGTVNQAYNEMMKHLKKNKNHKPE